MIKFPTSKFFMNGFSTQHHFCRNGNGGGIILYIREVIPSNLLSTEGNLLESFFVEINLGNKKKWLISCSYDPKRVKVLLYIPL